MGKRGPKPMNPRLRVLKAGGPAPDPAPQPDVPAGVPALPTDLDGDALAEWSRFGPVVARESRLTDAEAPAFAVYCRAYAVNRKAYREANAGMASITTDSGAEKANPSVAVFLRSADLMLKVLGLFGLTPADRARIGETQAPQKDALDEFFASTRNA